MSQFLYRRISKKVHRIDVSAPKSITATAIAQSLAKPNPAQLTPLNEDLVADFSPDKID